MKKLLTIFCCVLCMHSFAQSPLDMESGSQKLTGEKVLVKAILGIVNPHSNKKLPEKRLGLSGCDRP
jgi:hypothetical protein